MIGKRRVWNLPTVSGDIVYRAYAVTVDAVTTAIIWSRKPSLYSASTGRWAAAAPWSVRYSCRRLPSARNRAIRIVQITSQPEMSTFTASAPAMARSTKPMATVNTSRITMCLSQNEYDTRSAP